MGMSVTIGTAAGSDSEQILKLQYLCYQAEAEIHGDFRIPPLTQTAAGLADEMAAGPVLVARLGEEVVGSVRGRTDEDGVALISRLMVHPRLRRHGLGRRLLVACEAALAGPNTTCLRLRVGHRGARDLRWYGQFGYHEVAPGEAGVVTLEKTTGAPTAVGGPAGPVEPLAAGV